MSDVKQVEPISTRTKFLGFLCFSFICGLLILVALALVVGCLYYPKTVGLYLILPYVTWTRFLRRDEMHDGNHWPAFSQHFSLFAPMRNYLGLNIKVVPKQLNPDGQYIFAVFPHGVNADYRILMHGMLPTVFSKELANNIRALAASVLFCIPIVRELALWTGCVDARKSVATQLLQNKRSLLVLPGGQAEQILTIRGKEILYLKQRMGFVKLALQQDVPLVPVYVFGASDYYNTSHVMFGARQWLLKTCGICLPLATGSMGSPLCPFPVQTTIVIGNPMHVRIKETGNPTREEVEKAHAQFMTALNQLFDDNKTKLGYGDRQLEIR